MQNHLLFLAFFLPFTASAQLFLNFSQTTTGPCQYDPAVEVTQPDDWDIYQTIDDQWDSPVDSSKCFSVTDLGASARLPLDEVDPQRPLFFRAKFDPIELNPDWPHDIHFSINAPFGDPTLNTGTDCPNGLCSGLLIGVEIPDEAGTGTVLRSYPLPIVQDGPVLDMTACFISERFGGTLREFIFKLTFDETDLSSSFYDLGFSSFEMDFEPPNLLPPSIQVTPGAGGEYEVNVGELVTPGFSQNFLFLYPDTTYPSLSDIGHIDCRPEPNLPEPQVINITADLFQSVVFQPFTQLRGDTVLGDSIRHTVNFINNGNDFCLSFVELVFEDNAHFLYGSGNVDLGSDRACMMFRKGASLTLLDEATFHYGHDGIGFLAVGSDAEIRLGENSALLIDNKFLLIDAGGKEEATLDIHLEPGQVLAFGKNGHLLRSQWNPRPMFLDVHMLGGTLDDSNLSAGERQLIRRIYPPTAEKFADDVRLFPNPNNGFFTVEINLPEAKTLTAEIMDLHGKTVSRKEGHFPKGINQWSFEEALVSGVYFVKISAGGERTVSKVLVK